MRKNSYHSYRGRRSSGRSALAIVLVLVLAAACSVLFLQRYIIYSDDGSIRLELPFAAGEKEPPAGGKEPALSPPEMSLVVEDPAPTPPVEPEEPAGSPYGVHRLVELTQLPNDAAALAARLQEAGANGFVYRLRDNTGRVFYDSAAAVSSAAVGTVGTAEQLSTLCQAEGVVSVARFNCFHDSYYAWLNMESAGVCQSNGYIWYDNLSYHWLDPAKEQARAYVIALALECAQMGFDELLLEDVYYPTQGKLSKIDYSGSTMGKDAAIELFLNELRNALAGYDMKVTLLAPEALIGPESEAFTAVSGLSAGAAQRLFDAVYMAGSDPSAAEAALAAAAEEGESAAFVPVTADTTAAENWLIPAP